MASVRCLVESSFFVAWSYLERAGELGPPEASANILLDAIEALIKVGERRQLVLANKAIGAYRKHAALSRVLTAERQGRDQRGDEPPTGPQRG